MNIEVFERICNTAREQKATNNHAASSAKGTFSFGIVNSSRNGKRISFSQALMSALNLEDNNDVAVIAVPEEGVVMAARDLPFDDVIRGKLGKNGKWYNSYAVQLITELFNIDYSKHVSYAYNDISINELDGVPVATIRITKGTAAEENIA